MHIALHFEVQKNGCNLQYVSVLRERPDFLQGAD